MFVVVFKDLILRLVTMELKLGLEFGIGVMKERPQKRTRADIAPRRKMQPFEVPGEDLLLELSFAMGELCWCVSVIEFVIELTNLRVWCFCRVVYEDVLAGSFIITSPDFVLFR